MEINGGIKQQQRIIIQPNAGGQTEFLARSEREVLFGGQAGPGKTWALVFDALGLQFKHGPDGKAAIEYPNYRGVIFRRQSTEFTKLIDESKNIYPHFGGRFIHGRRGDPGPSWTFPSGARIFICHLQREDDKESHQGQEYQYEGFDEVTQFTLTQYLYLFSRLRGGPPQIIHRVRSTANPTGAGLPWVRSRFIKGMDPMKTYFFGPPAGDPYDNPSGTPSTASDPRAISRCFVPGKLEENAAHVDVEQYTANVMQLGSAFSKALLKGDWYAFAGDFFKEYDAAKMVIQPFAIPKEWQLIGSLDPGYSSPCSFSLRAKDFKGNVYRIATYYERERNPAQNAEGVRKFIEQCKETRGRMPSMIVSGLDAWAKKDRYAIVSNEVTMADEFQRAGLQLVRASTSRKQGWWAWRGLMKSGKWFVFDLMNTPLIDEMTAAQSGDRDPEDIKGKGNDPEVMDHALDEERYGNMAIMTPGETPVVKDQWFANALASGKTGKTWKPGQG